MFIRKEKKRPSFMERANRVPPMLCRLLARKNHGLAAMSNEEIAERSGVSTNTIVRLSTRRVWDDVTLRVMENFTRACGVNVEAPSRQIEFWKKRALSYMLRASPRQRMMYARILGELCGEVKPACGRSAYDMLDA